MMFEFPKFKKGMEVKAGGKLGVVTAIEWAGGEHWYEVHGKFFAENELSASK